MRRIKFKSSGMRMLTTMMLAVSLLLTVVSVQAEESEKFHRFWPDNLYAVEFVNDNVGFVGGYSGSLFKTEDGGETWSGVYMGSNELIRHLSFVDESNGWGIGHRGSIFHTSDGGVNWEIQKTDKGNYLRDISFADLNNGWAVGHNAVIWHTSDGGKTWEKQELTGFEGRDLPRLHGVIAKNASTAILVGEFGAVAHTEDAGNLWLVSYNENKATYLSVAIQGDRAIAVGLDGGIYTIIPSTQEQRKEVKASREAKWAKAVAKAKKKAKRKKKVYVPKERPPVIESDVDYSVSKIDSGSTQHFYDVTTSATGDAFVVGVSSLLKVSLAAVKNDAGDAEELTYSISALTSGEGFPLPFIWMGGVAVTPSGDIWAAGIRGLIVKGNTNDMTFNTKLNIAAPGAVKLISNRWGEK
ncbi:MAG: YCF48-related protein [Cycloclasticus sp.]